MRKRITKPARINLDMLYPEVSEDPEIEQEFADDFYDDYDPDEEYKNPENKRIIPDGEQAFFSAIKNGEDW